MAANRLSTIWNRKSKVNRDNLDNREGQTDGTPVDKYYISLPGLQKKFGVTLNFNDRDVKKVTNYKCTLIAPLCYLNYLCI